MLKKTIMQHVTFIRDAVNPCLSTSRLSQNYTPLDDSVKREKALPQWNGLMLPAKERVNSPNGWGNRSYWDSPSFLYRYNTWECVCVRLSAFYLSGSYLLGLAGQLLQFHAFITRFLSDKKPWMARNGWRLICCARFFSLLIHNFMRASEQCVVT